ncbi:Aspartate/glutamate/uridylate kinase [Pavlovales sp. CCMP2436]|nr:Aspartate/glutamate/uridylate kinase [Pavlovales sp. CCMP2436]
MAAAATTPAALTSICPSCAGLALTAAADAFAFAFRFAFIIIALLVIARTCTCSFASFCAGVIAAAASRAICALSRSCSFASTSTGDALASMVKHTAVATAQPAAQPAAQHTASVPGPMVQIVEARERTSLRSRADLATAQRIVVKVGTSTVSRPDGSVSLGRIGHIVEQLSELHLAGRDVMLVSSGAVGVGRGKLRKQQLFSRSVQSSIGGGPLEPPSVNACAAAGQSGVMGLYEQLFGQYDVLCAQVLVSPADFHQEAKVDQLKHSLLWLLSHQTIPVLNENGVSTGPKR